jgi:hypothetical protein
MLLIASLVRRSAAKLNVFTLARQARKRIGAGRRRFQDRIDGSLLGIE